MLAITFTYSGEQEMEEWDHYQFDYRTGFLDFLYKAKLKTIMNIAMRNTDKDR